MNPKKHPAYLHANIFEVLYSKMCVFQLSTTRNIPCSQDKLGLLLIVAKGTYNIGFVVIDLEKV